MAKAKQTEIAQKEPAEIQQQRVPSVLEIINRIADNPNVAVDTMKGLFDLQVQYESREAEKAYNVALARLQPRLPRIEKKSRVNYPNKQGGKTDFHFASYEDIDKQIRPLLSDEGFSVSFDQKKNGTATEYSIKLAHVQGHSETRTMVLPDDTSGGKNSIQAVGSTVTYARRYLLTMVLNIVTEGEDTDGEIFITPEQVHTLKTRCEEVGGDAVKFLQYMGVQAFEAIRSQDYDRAIQRLFDKAAQRLKEK